MSQRLARQFLYVFMIVLIPLQPLLREPRNFVKSHWGQVVSTPTCGKWEFVPSKDPKDLTLKVKQYDEGSSNDNCTGIFYVENETNYRLSGLEFYGYSYELITQTVNAKVQWKPEQKNRFGYAYVAPEQILTTYVTPQDLTKEATVYIRGNLSLDSLKLDLAVFIVKTISSKIPCLPVDSALLNAANFANTELVDRVVEQLQKWPPDFRKAVYEINLVIDDFLKEVFLDVAQDCLEGLLDRFTDVGKAWLLVQVNAWWINVIGSHYLYPGFGQDVVVELKYTPAEQKLPIELPEEKPVTMPQISPDRNQAYLGDQLLLDVIKDAPGCFGVDKIVSPPLLNYFLVLLDCFEGDNDGFLFSVDGKEKHKITGQFDYINYSNVALSPDGNAFVYERINSCCHSKSELPSNVPKAGIIFYDINTHRKKVLVPDVYLIPMEWSLDSEWIAYFFNNSTDPNDSGKLFLVDSMGSEIWMIDNTLTRSDCSKLDWKFKDQSDELVLSCISSNDTATKSFMVYGKGDTPPTDSAIREK
jgi:hypothetical protein